MLFFGGKKTPRSFYRCGVYTLVPRTRAYIFTLSGLKSIGYRVCILLVSILSLQELKNYNYITKLQNILFKIKLFVNSFVQEKCPSPVRSLNLLLKSFIINVYTMNNFNLTHRFTHLNFDGIWIIL